MTRHLFKICMLVGGFFFEGQDSFAKTDALKETNPDDRESVLIIGDSMLWGKFGQNLHQLTSNQGKFDVYSVSSCAARGDYFLKGRRTHCGYRVRTSTVERPTPKTIKMVKAYKTPTIFELMKLVEPSYIVVQLGLNYGSLAPKKIAGRSHHFLQEIFNKKNPQLRKVVWICPPNYRYAERINQGLRRGLFPHSEKIYFVDGTGFNRNQPLGVKDPHLKGYKAHRWANYVFSWVKGHLRTLSEQKRAQDAANTSLKTVESFSAKCPPNYCHSERLMRINKIDTPAHIGIQKR